MPEQPRLPLWFLIANWVLILASFAMGVWIGGERYGNLPDPQRRALELVYQTVLESHIEPPDEHELLERAISGMVDGLDAYSRYYPPEEVPRYDETTTGNYEGIGAKIVTHGEDVVVHFPFPGSPADRAGLLPGDRVLRVDDESLAKPEARARVVELLRGPADSTVRLTVARGDDDLIKRVERGSVQTPCVKWVQFVDREAGLGYAYLGDFHPTAAAQVQSAIEHLERDGELKGLILDLRFDGGGSLDQCLDIARLFVPSGVIATQQRPQLEDEVYEAVPERCRWPELPLVVLVNQQSASASEVLSGALQDHERAAIVGVRTHGKGYVNTVYSWRGFDFKLKLTTGSYRTPSGRNIERNQATAVNPADDENGGIFPDVEVALDEEQSVRVYHTLRSVIEVPERFAEGYRRVAERYGFEIEQGPTPATDPQLDAALTTLRDRVGK